jgi:hypothetical protein
MTVTIQVWGRLSNALLQSIHAIHRCLWCFLANDVISLLTSSWSLHPLYILQQSFCSSGRMLFLSKWLLILFVNAVIRILLLLLFMLFSNTTKCPLWTSWSPSWLWLKCNRLLRLGRPWGAVMLSRWGGWWYMDMDYREGP